MSYRPRIDPAEFARQKKEKEEAARIRRAQIAESKRSSDPSASGSESADYAQPSSSTAYDSTSNNGYEEAGSDEKADYSSSSSHYERKQSSSSSSSEPPPSSKAAHGGSSSSSKFKQWFLGPLNQSGSEFNPASFEEKKRLQSGPSSDSDRPTTCMSVSPNGSECVVGSSDHASYTFSTHNATPLRRLYSKASGHTDWVTCAAYLSDNRIVTGGMDGKMCLWRRGGSDCQDLFGEQGSVSVLRSLSADSPLAASAGYDGSVCVWNFSGARSSMEKISNARKQLPPLTALAISNATSGSVALSGSNNGLLSLWDLSSSKCTKAAVGKHGSQVQHIGDGGGGVFFTGSVDGKVGLFDTRGQLGSANGNEIGATDSATPFVDRRRAGAAPISGLCVRDNDCHIVVSGADGNLALLDRRKNLAQIGEYMTGHTKPVVGLCLGASGSVCFSGAMDGMVICHDLNTLKPLYGMGANKGSAGFLACTEDRLIVSGDDGHALIYSFS